MNLHSAENFECDRLGCCGTLILIFVIFLFVVFGTSPHAKKKTEPTKTSLISKLDEPNCIKR